MEDRTGALKKREGVFVIEAAISGLHLKVSGFERTDREERPVKSYKEIKFNEDRLKDYTKGITDLLNRANRRGKIGHELLVKLKEYGGLLFDELVPVEIKDKLVKTREKNLMISIDDKLVHIPWELLFDGEDFLCRKFSMGRSVSTKQSVSPVKRVLGRPLKMQVIADPEGDLPASYEEGVGIKNEIGQYDDWIVVSLKTTDVKTDYVKSKVRSFDILHFAGHAEHNAVMPDESGWILKDGKLSAKEIINMTGVAPMPSLVFSNACQTGQTDEWKLEEDYGDRIFGLANAFLLTGVHHYIGTFWEIPDEAGYYFAGSFYKNLVASASIGEALRKARHELIGKYGEDTMVWASYMLYGDPTTRYIDMEAGHMKREPEKRPEREHLAHSELRSKDDLIHISWKKRPQKTMLLGGIGAFIIAVLFMAFMNFDLKDNSSTKNGAIERGVAAKEGPVRLIDEQAALLAALYREGKFEQRKTVHDEWSSQPLTMVLMDIMPEGGDSERFNNLLSQSLQLEARITLVERKLLSRLLEELKLSYSNLSDTATALKIGKVLSARIIVTGSIVPEKNGQTVLLRFIDTETTAIRKTISEGSASKDIGKDLTGNIAGKIIEWVRADFPIRGKILSTDGDKCKLNIGQIHGIKKGDRLEVVSEAQKGSGIYVPTGELEVSEVFKDKSVAVVVNKKGSLKEGVKVKWKA